MSRVVLNEFSLPKTYSLGLNAWRNWPSKVKGLDLFLEANDTDNIIISERVYQHLQSKGYTDIYFEELETI